MKLTIITPSIRVGNLQQISKTIPEGVDWIVVFDLETMPENCPKNAKCYLLRKPTRGYPQSNLGLDKVKDGWVYFLDDDTLLHPDFYTEISKCINQNKTADFIHFNQETWNGKFRIGGKVEENKIDKGNFVVKRELVGEDRFKNCASADGMFAELLFKKALKPIYLNKTLSTYNAIRPVEKDQYTIIIPTMWYYPKRMLLMIKKYQECSYVGEVLIINNREAGRIEVPYNKVRIIGEGENIFVNPAWNLGVLHSKTKKVVLANDDIEFKTDSLDDFFTVIDRELKPGIAIGPHSSAITKYGFKPCPIRVDRGGLQMGAGAGIFIILHKNDYHMMPKELPIWHGDLILYELNQYHTFRGIEIETEMRGTSARLMCDEVEKQGRLKEREFYLPYRANGFKPLVDRETKLRVMLVWKKGGDFAFRDIQLLATNLHKKSNCDVEVFCITEGITKEVKMTCGVTLIPMKYVWKSWWAKMNLFSPEIEKYRPFLYVDLDTAVVGKLDEFMPPVPKYNNYFITLNDFYRPGLLASGLMWFPKVNKKLDKIWNTWIKSPEQFMKTYRGDQDFIRSIIQADEFFQNITNRVVSFKPRQNSWRISLPDVASIVCFHGHPRIWKAAPKVKWVKQYINGEL